LALAICSGKPEADGTGVLSLEIHHLTRSAPHRRAVLYFLAIVISGKLAILSLLGPSIWPDTGAYVSFADAILANGEAFHPIDWTGGSAAPPFVFRLAGYPLVLAVAKLLSPRYYGSITVIFQIFLNMLAVILIFRVADCLAFSVNQIIFALALYVFSDSFLFDNSLLSDSIYGSLFNIVIFSLIGHVVGCWRLTLAGTLGLGLLWGFSTWTRDSGIYFTYLPIILLTVIAFRTSGGVLPRLGHLLAFTAVVVAMVGAYAMLNKYRTGEFFFSITGVENWLRPVFDMAQYKYAEPFAGNDLVSETVRESMPEYGYTAQLEFIERLHKRCECTPTQLQSLVFAKYLSTVLHHPLAYIQTVWRNFHYLGLAALLADPVATVNQFVAYATPVEHKIAPGLSIRNLVDLQQQFSVVTLLLMILNALSTVAATVLFSLFLFGIPYLTARARCRREPIPPALAIVGFLWFSFVSVSVVFSLVHYEARHALPILPAGCIGIVYVFSRLVSSRRSDVKSSLT
jgi:hypothetical protein